MSSGMRAWGADGVLQMDTDSFTYQIIHNQVYTLTLGAVITLPIPGFSPSTCSCVMLPTTPAANPYCYYAMPFQSVSEGSVVIRSKNPSETGNYGSTIQFRLLIMRYKN